MIRSRMAKALADNKMTQKDLAKKADLTEAAVSKYMSGERAANEISLIKICKALNVSADFLLGIEAEPIVRCKDCVWYGQTFLNKGQCLNYGLPFKPDEFCSSGKQRYEVEE